MSAIDAPSASRELGTTEKVAEVIRAGIRSGQFAPGQHLVEVDLTRSLQISRSSLREALRHLNGDGIVTMSRYRGAHISRLSRKAVDDLLEVLEQLVRLAARRAAMSDGAKRALMDAAIQAALKHALTADQNNYLVVRQAFYDALFALSQNEELPRVTPLRRADLFRSQMRPFQTQDDQRAHAEGYKTIAQAVADGDPQKAEDAVAAHFKATRVMVKKLPPEAFEPA